MEEILDRPVLAAKRLLRLCQPTASTPTLFLNTEHFDLKPSPKSDTRYLLKPDNRSTARTVFATSMVMVIGPTLPGTGVM
jgi:hypothetical protein